MIEITKFAQAMESLKNSAESIRAVKLAAHEGHLINKLKDQAGVILAAVYPTLERQGKQDATKDLCTTWIFVLEKMNTSATDQQEIDQYQKLQQIALKLIESVQDGSSCSIYFKWPDSETTLIPEYNQFGGFNGWSFNLTF
nr:hypothetical protein [uncultured Pedobacter sp.]